MEKLSSSRISSSGSAQQITPFLWFDGNAEQAAKFYCSVFKNSKIGSISRHNKKPLCVAFRLNGQDFISLNGGPAHKFNHAVSFAVNCKTQKEIDSYWAKLSKGGEGICCGWLRDKFGLSWQVVPTLLGEMMCDKDAARVFLAVQKMIKLDIKGLKRAFDGKN